MSNSIGEDTAINQENSFPDSDVGKKFSQAQLRQDFLIFRKALEEAHPGLYRYTDKKTLDAKFEKELLAIHREMSEAEFYGLISRILSEIKDGHTSGLPSSELSSFLSNNAKRFPFRLRFIGEKAYIIGSPETSIPAGSELLSINGKPIAEINQTLFKYLTTDGTADSGKIWQLNQTFASYFYLFIESADSFAVEFYNPAKKATEKLNVAALTRSEAIARIAQTAIPATPQNAEPLQLKFYPDARVAYLKIGTFGDGTQNIPQFFENSFRDIKNKNIQNLIIDVRGNGGGRDDYGSLLFSYLTNKEFKYYNNLETTTNKISFLEYTDSDASLNDRLAQAVEQTEAGKFRWKESNHPNLKIQKPQKMFFAKKVWILTDGRSFSTTSEFAAFAQSEKRAVFVGEETGGGYYGNTSGMMLKLTLPNTKSRIEIPLIRYNVAVQDKPGWTGGIAPDYLVQPSIEDILKGVDRELQYTLELIKKA